MTDLSFFERRYALSIVLAVKAEPGRSKRQVIMSLGADSKAMRQIIDGLTAMGMMEQIRGPRNAQNLYLTEKGEQLAALIGLMDNLVEASS